MASPQDNLAAHHLVSTDYLSATVNSQYRLPHIEKEIAMTSKKLDDVAKAENEQNKIKQRYEEKAVKESPVEGEIQPDQKVVPSQPDPTDETRWENDPSKNPYAPGGIKFGGA
jgi:hypothetical protein